MNDNDHEGHSGKLLADIRGYLDISLPTKPNVICIHAGTNDMDKGENLDKAPSTITSIIDRAFGGSPGITVLVTPVIWADDPRMQKNTDAFNKKLATIIREKQKKGQHILSVPIDIKKSELHDRKHPNEAGYEKMTAACQWYKAILDANGRGWIKAPIRVDADKLPGLGLGTHE